MPSRCVAGGCSKTRKDGVSLHRWPDDPHFVRLWTNAVKNTRSDFINPTTSSKLCSEHFDEDFFEPQTAIAKSMGLKMKKIIKANAVPGNFKSAGQPQKKKQRREQDDDREGKSHEARAAQSGKKPLRGAYRKREVARVCLKREKKNGHSSL